MFVQLENPVNFLNFRDLSNLIICQFFPSFVIKELWGKGYSDFYVHETAVQSGGKYGWVQGKELEVTSVDVITLVNKNFITTNGAFHCLKRRSIALTSLLVSFFTPRF